MTSTRYGRLSVAILAFLLGFGLDSSPAAAQMVLFEDGGRPEMATGINGLDVGGVSYDVVFQIPRQPRFIYGNYPGTYTLTSEAGAMDAVRAVVAALDNSPATSVGRSDATSTSNLFAIGYGSQLGPPDDVQQCRIANGRYSGAPPAWGELWTELLDYNDGTRVFAVFALAVSAEESSVGALKARYDK